MNKNQEKKKLKSAIVPYWDISVDVENSEMCLSFPNICRDLIHLKMFEEMVHTRLWLGSRQQVTLCWWNDPNIPEYLVMDKDAR
ncbi:hypothetical protein MKX03_009649 [Papaver bracteatum]|nr:hypothetical protein MKX03_009649 [Papaver bracteatum]